MTRLVPGLIRKGSINGIVWSLDLDLIGEDEEIPVYFIAMEDTVEGKWAYRWKVSTIAETNGLELAYVGIVGTALNFVCKVTREYIEKNDKIREEDQE